MDRVIYKKRENRGNESEVLDVSGIFNSWFVKVVFLVVSGIFVYSVYKSVSITIQKLEILNRAENEVEDLRLENLDLSVEMMDMSTNEYLEKEARDRLNLNGKKEIMFVFKNNSLKIAEEKVDEILSQKEEDFDNGGNVLAWKDFIFNGYK